MRSARCKSKRVERPAPKCFGAPRRGGAYVLALVTLLTGLTLGLAMLRAASTHFTNQDSRAKKQAATNLAEAGIDYAYWQIHHQNSPLPYSADVTLETGIFQVKATDDGDRDPSTMLITATGTRDGHSHAAKRVTIGALPYHYTYCENKNADDAHALISDGPGPGFRVNGHIKFDSLNTQVTSGAWATTTIATKGAITPQHPNSPPIAFPEIDYAYYASVADRMYVGDTSFVAPGIPANAVIVVNGKADISGPYAGMCTIVTTDDIRITGSLWPLNQNSHLALITQRHIDVEAEGVLVQAVMYAHKADNSGEVHTRRQSIEIVGVMASDDNRTDEDLTIRYDTRLNIDVMRELHLPGL